MRSRRAEERPLRPRRRCRPLHSGARKPHNAVRRKAARAVAHATPAWTRWVAARWSGFVARPRIAARARNACGAAASRCCHGDSGNAVDSTSCRAFRRGSRWRPSARAADGREKPPHRLAYWRAVMYKVPSRAMACRMAECAGPSGHRRQGGALYHLLELARLSLEVERDAFWPRLCCHAAKRRNDGRMAPPAPHRHRSRKRVGAEIARALLEDGWAVVAHVHHKGTSAGGRLSSGGGLPISHARNDLRGRGRAPAVACGQNAARFAWTALVSSSAEFDLHMASTPASRAADSSACHCIRSSDA